MQFNQKIFHTVVIELAAGFTIAEIIIAAAIVSIGVAGIIEGFTAYSNASGVAVPQVEATLLAEEGVEAAMVMRDSAWTTTLGTYTIGTPYYLVWSSGTWVATTTATTTDGTYYRTITFSSVYRDGNSQITGSGGTLDSGSRLVTSSVSWWNRTATSTVTLQSYLSKLFNN